MKVLEAVEHDLAKLPPDLGESALAAIARAMAESMDSPRISHTARSMCGRLLLDTIERLLELAPADQKKDRLDDLATRRATRISAAQG